MSTFTTGGHELPHDFDLFFDIKTLEELKAEVSAAMSKLTVLARLVDRHQIEGVNIPELFFVIAKQQDELDDAEEANKLSPEEEAKLDAELDASCQEFLASIYHQEFGPRLEGIVELLDKVPAATEKIKSYAANPTIEGWDDVHGYIINRDRFLTLWQAVIAVDSTFPRVGRTTDIDNNIIKEWTRIPDAELIKQALAYAAH